MSQKDLPIGLFDSGMGGLSVCRAFIQKLPAENLLYLGDTARLPYGTKGRETIIRYTLQAAQILVQRGIKMLVVACNTATAMALSVLRQTLHPLPVLGVVEPGARAAVQACHNDQILVLATEATIASQVYRKAIAAIQPNIQLQEKACTLFVSVAEEGLTEGLVAETVAHHYLDPIFATKTEQSKPDTLLLGCTHFPLLRQTLQKVAGTATTIIDPAETVVKTAEHELFNRDLLHSVENGSANLHFMTTDNKERFISTGSLFLGRPLDFAEVELVDL